MLHLRCYGRLTLMGDVMDWLLILSRIPFLLIIVVGLITVVVHLRQLCACEQNHISKLDTLNSINSKPHYNLMWYIGLQVFPVLAGSL